MDLCLGMLYVCCLIWREKRVCELVENTVVLCCLFSFVFLILIFIIIINIWKYTAVNHFVVVCIKIGHFFLSQIMPFFFMLLHWVQDITRFGSWRNGWCDCTFDNEKSLFCKYWSKWLGKAKTPHRQPWFVYKLYIWYNLGSFYVHPIVMSTLFIVFPKIFLTPVLVHFCCHFFFHISVSSLEVTCTYLWGDGEARCFCSIQSRHITTTWYLDVFVSQFCDTPLSSSTPLFSLLLIPPPFVLDLFPFVSSECIWCNNSISCEQVKILRVYFTKLCLQCTRTTFQRHMH